MLAALLGLLGFSVWLFLKPEPIPTAPAAAPAQNKMALLDFIKKARPAAQTVRPYGLNPDYAVLQAAHESRNGDAELTTSANNVLGIMGGDWVRQGRPVVWRKTWEWSPYAPAQIRYWQYEGDIIEKRANTSKGGTDCLVNRPFRKYDSWAACFEDWAKLLQGPRFVAVLAAARARDPQAFSTFSRAMETAKYATDPNGYAAKLDAVAAAARSLGVLA